MKKGALNASTVAWIIVLVVMLTIVVIGITYKIRTIASNAANSTGECASDADCVANSCCHPSSCTTKENAPSCAGIMCTQECVANTLDCGQASCKCTNNKCTTLLK